MKFDELRSTVQAKDYFKAIKEVGRDPVHRDYLWDHMVQDLRILSLKPMVGCVLDSIEKTSDRIWGDQLVFWSEGQERFILRHEQYCCQSVHLEDICGDLNDLVGSPILLAEEVSHRGLEEGVPGTCTWTFYRFRTIKGTVTVRWYGESNGFYSEEVNFVCIDLEG